MVTKADLSKTSLIFSSEMCVMVSRPMKFVAFPETVRTMGTHVQPDGVRKKAAKNAAKNHSLERHDLVDERV